MTAGIYQPGLSFRRYVEIGKDKPMLTVNASLLKAAITPLHAKFYLEQEESAGSEALSLGDAFHKAVLEPSSYDDHFDDFYMMCPTKGLDTKKADECRLIYPDHILVNQEIIDKVRWMRDAVFRHDLASHFLKNLSHRELTGVAPDPAGGGFLRKIRIDACEGIGEAGKNWSPYLVDLKSTRKIDPRGFARDISDLGYDVQAAFYLDTDAMITGKMRDAMFFIACTNFAPYCARIYTIAPEQIQKARDIYQHRLAALITAYQTGRFEAFEHESEPVALFV